MNSFLLGHKHEFYLGMAHLFIFIPPLSQPLTPSVSLCLFLFFFISFFFFLVSLTEIDHLSFFLLVTHDQRFDSVQENMISG